jgi:RNA polymerase sigma-70 factor (ECF subfamily)
VTSQPLAEASDDRSQKRQVDVLLDAAIQGDPAALRTLLRELAPEVARVVTAILGPSDMSLDDAIQEALLAIVHALPNFRRDCSARRFANRIAARTALLTRRRLLASRSRETILVPAPPTADGGDHAELDRRRRAFVRRMFDLLPEAQGQVLALRFLLGYSLEETAEAVGAPVNTVRSRIRLAKEAMREKLAADPLLLAAFEGGAS